MRYRLLHEFKYRSQQILLIFEFHLFQWLPWWCIRDNIEMLTTSLFFYHTWRVACTLLAENYAIFVRLTNTVTHGQIRQEPVTLRKPAFCINILFMACNFLQ